MKTKLLLPVLLTILMLLISGCSQDASGAAGAAAERYFQSIVDGDEDRIATVSCPDWETSAREEVAAFAGVKARLQDVTCAPVTSGETEVTVECSGAIVATYNNEDQTFELKDRPLKVVNQGGEWLVCGFAGE